MIAAVIQYNFIRMALSVGCYLESDAILRRKGQNDLWLLKSRQTLTQVIVTRGVRVWGPMPDSKRKCDCDEQIKLTDDNSSKTTLDYYRGIKRKFTESELMVERERKKSIRNDSVTRARLSASRDCC